MSRRGILKEAKNKVLIEAGKRPKSAVASKLKGATGNLNGMNIADKLNKVKLGIGGKLASKITKFL